MRCMLRQVTDGRGWPVLANIVRAGPDGRSERVFMQKELFGPEEYRQVVAYHYRMERHQAMTKHARRTHHIERFNNTLRQRLSHLVRETLSFSEKLTHDLGARKYFICHDNVTRAAA